MNTYGYCIPPTTKEEEASIMAPMFLRILSPVDFHENSLAALQYTAQFARQYDATVYLLHVVPTDELHLHREVYRPEKGGGADVVWAEKMAKEKLQEIAREHLSGGIRYEILTRVGDAAKITLETAQEIGAELIVMATHGRTGISHFFLGSVAERVVREASCPVLTIRSK
jgi:universal stress protein A